MSPDLTPPIVDADADAPQRRWVRTAPWWRRVLAHSGLQGKLVVGFLLLLFVALGVSCWLFLAGGRRAMGGIMGEQATQISMALGLASRQALAAEDSSELQRLGKDLLQSRNIVFVAFLDAGGEPIAVACRDPEFGIVQARTLRNSARQLMQVRAERSPVLGRYLQVVTPVFGPPTAGAGAATRPGQRLVGYVAVGLSHAREEAQLEHVSFISLSVGAMIFLFSLPIACVLVHRILLPIRELVRATNAVAAGRYDAAVAVHRPDEIGDLARSFNEMTGRVRRQQEELRDANRTLEEKVRLRTGELEASNRRLSSEIAEKEDFLRAVSHDLNAPLRNIGGMAAMLLMKNRDRFDADVIHRLERIQRNVEVETDLIAELLELSRIKTRRQRIEPVDLAALVRDVGGVFEQDLLSRGITLRVESPLPTLPCERARVRQVFQNLIDNAIKYMGDGPVREVCIGCAPGADGAAEFWVRDTGIGIDADDLGALFRVFRRGKGPAVQGVAGKGVGLASVKSIVETHGGRIWVDSVPGQGSTFRFTLGAPATAEPPAARAA